MKKHSAPAKFGNPDLDESFRHILAKADNSITQAESILSSLTVESSEIPAAGENAKSNKVSSASLNSGAKAQISRSKRDKAAAAASIAAKSQCEESSSDTDPASLGSDIETNIRRLEKTQAKINAALATFRSVQALSSAPNSAQPGRKYARQRSLGAQLNHYEGASMRPNLAANQEFEFATSAASASGAAGGVMASPASVRGKSQTAPAKMESLESDSPPVPPFRTSSQQGTRYCDKSIKAFVKKQSNLKCTRARFNFQCQSY